MYTYNLVRASSVVSTSTNKEVPNSQIYGMVPHTNLKVPVVNQLAGKISEIPNRALVSMMVYL